MLSNLPPRRFDSAMKHVAHRIALTAPCLVQNRTDQAVDEAIKKALLDSCDVNADKVRGRYF